MYIHDVGWQVPALAMLFFTLGCGNIITTSMTIPLKLNDSKTGLLKYRFTRLDKYFWNHRKRRNSISKANPKFVEKVDNVPSPQETTPTLRSRILMRLDRRPQKSLRCCQDLVIKELKTLLTKTLEKMKMKARSCCDIFD